MKPVPILDIKADDWMKGLSAASGLPIGGIFTTSLPHDPFDLPGFARASVGATTVDATTITTAVKFLVSAIYNGVGYVFGLGDRSGTAAKCFYRIKTSDNTVTDYSTGVYTNSATGAVTGMGATNYWDQNGNNFIIYVEGNAGSVRRVALDGIGDAAINTLSSYNTAYKVAFCPGPDGYLYFTGSMQTGRIGQLYHNGSWQFNEAKFYIRRAYLPKDISNDGNYLIIIGDDNPTNVTTASASCGVFFFDVGGTTWAKDYYIPDKYLIAVRHVAGNTYVIGASGIWLVGYGISPQLIRPLTSGELPQSPYDVTVDGSILRWTNSINKVYSYGHKYRGSPILYTPHTVHSSDNVNAALTMSGDYLYAAITAGTNTPKVKALAYGTTRDNMSVITVEQHLPQPYSFSHAKVTLRSPMSEGMAVSISGYRGTDNIWLTTTRSFTTNGAFKSLRIPYTPVATPIRDFDSFSIMVTAEGGAVVDRVTIYGYPIDDDSQQI